MASTIFDPGIGTFDPTTVKYQSDLAIPFLDDSLINQSLDAYLKTQEMDFNNIKTNFDKVGVAKDKLFNFRIDNHLQQQQYDGLKTKYGVSEESLQGLDVRDAYGVRGEADKITKLFADSAVKDMMMEQENITAGFNYMKTNPEKFSNPGMQEQIMEKWAQYQNGEVNGMTFNPGNYIPYDYTTDAVDMIAKLTADIYTKNPNARPEQVESLVGERVNAMIDANMTSERYRNSLRADGLLDKDYKPTAKYQDWKNNMIRGNKYERETYAKVGTGAGAGSIQTNITLPDGNNQMVDVNSIPGVSWDATTKNLVSYNGISYGAFIDNDKGINQEVAQNILSNVLSAAKNYNVKAEPSDIETIKEMGVSAKPEDIAAVISARHDGFGVKTLKAFASSLNNGKAYEVIKTQGIQLGGEVGIDLSSVESGPTTFEYSTTDPKFATKNKKFGYAGRIIIHDPKLVCAKCNDMQDVVDYLAKDKESYAKMKIGRQMKDGKFAAIALEITAPLNMNPGMGLTKSEAIQDALAKRYAKLSVGALTISSPANATVANESSGNPSAVNSTTQAMGLYQFTPSSWMRTAQEKNGIKGATLGIYEFVRSQFPGAIPKPTNGIYFDYNTLTSDEKSVVDKVRGLYTKGDIKGGTLPQEAAALYFLRNPDVQHTYYDYVSNKEYSKVTSNFMKNIKDGMLALNPSVIALVAPNGVLSQNKLNFIMHRLGEPDARKYLQTGKSPEASDIAAKIGLIPTENSGSVLSPSNNYKPKNPTGYKGI